MALVVAVVASCTVDSNLERGRGALVDSRTSPEQSIWDVYQRQDGGLVLVESAGGVETGRLVQAVPTPSGGTVLSVQTVETAVQAEFDPGDQLVSGVPAVADAADLEALASQLVTTFESESSPDQIPCATCASGLWGYVAIAAAVVIIGALIRALTPAARNGCGQVVGCVNRVVRACVAGCRASGRDPCRDPCETENAAAIEQQCLAGASDAARSAYGRVDECLSTECTIEKLANDRNLLRFNSKEECLESVCSDALHGCN